MAVRVLGTGVLLRLATEAEVGAIERARHGRHFQLEPSRSYRYTEPDRTLARGEAYVVGQAYVDFADGDGEQHWAGSEYHGHRVSTLDDPAIDLLRLAREIAEDGLVDLLAELRIAGRDVSRWELMSAPHRIELAAELEARLAPLRRG